ncbi:hydroxyacylglutathione hydrolase [Methyloversatilis thermotolerans]|uniref:hydroxyacylglutathione hydrolase n=1 Tax=Methyloversatilis thermotolerans TaxID=1346290 RepID=UPI0003625DDC|nr:hydroxyacylglutathione hydrolase [Methyloversatilis thermotolerans]
MKIYPIPAFGDNYLWLATSGDRALVVDPGDAAPVLAALEHHSLRLDTILITHHHADHTGGTGELKRRTGARVFGPADERIEHLDDVVREGSRIELSWLPTSLAVLEVPGHTRSHIAYCGAGSLFCGDTLFAGGCGRLFEGSAEQMWHSLSRLASLPLHTLIYCAHEYTAANLRFAQAVEPDNDALSTRIRRVNRLRERGQATLPCPLAIELATNPFLRVREPAVIRAAESFAGRRLDTPVEVFAALREWKNRF